MHVPLVALQHLLRSEAPFTRAALESLIRVLLPDVRDHLVLGLSSVIAIVMFAGQPNVAVWCIPVTDTVDLQLALGVEHAIAVGAGKRRGMSSLAMGDQKSPIGEGFIAP